MTIAPALVKAVFVLLLTFASVHHSFAREEPAKRSPREALAAFNDLVGSWRATGTPEGTREQKQRGFWTESLAWSWKFQGDDAWLKVNFTKGKHFSKGELHYLPEKDLFQFRAVTPAKETIGFEGRLTDHLLTLERQDENKKESQRLTFTLLHGNRFLYRYEVKPQERTLYTRLYQVGATKEGVPFAAPGESHPECVVTGGLGTLKTIHQGRTYYFCCSGCRDAFQDNPEKYIKEFEARKAKEAKDKKP